MYQKIAMRILFLHLVCFVLARCNVSHPCGCNVEEQCVREYLAGKSTCEIIVNGKNLDPSYLAGFHLEAPAFNVSEYKYDSKFLGLANSYPVLLKVDESANYTILTVFHPEVIFEGTIDIFFFSEGNAPVTVTTTFVDTFTNFTTTTMIPGTETLDMDSGRTFGALTSPPTIVLGDNVQEEMANNELVNRTLTLVFEDLTTLAAEEGLAIYPNMARSYFGQNLCTYNEN